VQASQAARDIAVSHYEKTIQTAFREVADALASRTALAEQADALRRQAEAERDRFRLADLRYRNGVSNYLDMLDAHSDRCSPRSSHWRKFNWHASKTKSACTRHWAAAGARKTKQLHAKWPVWRLRARPPRLEGGV